jgi:hypothetical protein
MTFTTLLSLAHVLLLFFALKSIDAAERLIIDESSRHRQLVTALTDDNFFTACDAWVADPAAASAEYGDIKGWDTSAITNMQDAFEDAFAFNDDISAWDTSSVTTMRGVSNERIIGCLGCLRIAIDRLA